MNHQNGTPGKETEVPGFEVTNLKARIVALEKEIMTRWAYLEESRDSIFTDVIKQIRHLESQLELKRIEKERDGFRGSLRRAKGAEEKSPGFFAKWKQKRQEKKEAKLFRDKYLTLLEALDELDLSIGITTARAAENLNRRLVETQNYLVEAERKGVKIFSSLGDCQALISKVTDMQKEAVRISHFIFKLRLEITEGHPGWFKDYKPSPEIEEWHGSEKYHYGLVK